MKEAPEIDDSRGFQNFLLILVRGQLVLDLPIDGTDDKHPAQRPFYSHSMALYLSSRHSSCTQFSVPSRDECRQVTPCRVSSASGTKAGTTPKTFFKLKGIEFLFLSQRARRTAFGGSISPKTPVLKLNRPLACKPPASTASESALVACATCAKPQLTGLRHRWSK